MLYFFIHVQIAQVTQPVGSLGNLVNNKEVQPQFS